MCNGLCVVLSVCQVYSSEERVVLRAWLSQVVLIEEDRRAAHLNAQLLHALLVIDGEQERLATLIRPHSRHDGEVFWKNGSCRYGETIRKKIINVKSFNL